MLSKNALAAKNHLTDVQFKEHINIDFHNFINFVNLLRSIVGN